MKKMKQLFAVLLAFAMVMGLATTGMAADTTYTITAPAAEGEVSHTYEVYQIFTGDLNEGVLSNVTWGGEWHWRDR